MRSALDSGLSAGNVPLCVFIYSLVPRIDSFESQETP